jgi:hypothetical protein
MAAIPAGTEWRKANPIVGTAPSVAPTSGMRSAKATHRASTSGYGTPARRRNAYAATPAITLMTTLPNM